METWQEIVVFLLIGLAAGWLAGMIMKSGFGLVGDLIVGVIGSVLGGFLFGLVGISSGRIVGQILVATAGACLLLFILRKVKRP